ncbi:MAG: hypothetical protein JOZ80_09515 [Acidobacteriaceae bacterium]|nr:hypothetical protein [Acidobacteriaceae bacterium]
MLNAHLRFGSLTYYRRTDKTTTHFQLHLDRFIGEVAPDPPRQAKAHLLSVIGSETQISAVAAAIHMEEAFTVEAPGLAPIRALLGRNAQCYRGSIQLRDRKRAVRHVIGVSEEFATASASSGRTLLAHPDPSFVWASLAHMHGLPGVPEWADWFHRQLSRHDSIVPLLGIGCQPVLVKGTRDKFLAWLSEGVRAGHLPFPQCSGPIQWAKVGLRQLFQIVSE